MAGFDPLTPKAHACTLASKAASRANDVASTRGAANELALYAGAIEEGLESMAEREPEHLYRTHGTCSRAILFDVDADNKVHNVSFVGGCNGNLKGIGQLIEGADAEWVIERLKGTQCGGKPTSCPDQLARALEGVLEQR